MKDVIIIGGGVSAFCVAIAFAQKNIKVKILKKK